MTDADFSTSCGFIKDCSRLSRVLGVAESRLYKNSGEYEGKYNLKNIPKKGGGERELNVPNDELKLIQRRINSRIFSTIFYPEYVFGGIPAVHRGTDYVDVARHHQGASIKAELDIQSYFPSINNDNVFRIYKKFFCFPDQVAEALTGLSMVEGELPQGAPTSVALANLCFFESEPLIFKQLQKRGFKYSRFIDDIVITSTDIESDIDQARIRVENMVTKAGFQLNGEKTIPREKRFSGLTVFGFLISDANARVGRKEVKGIRAGIQQLERQAKQPNQRKLNSYHESWHKISGRLNKLKRLDHPKYNHYRLRLRKILPLLSEKELKRLAQRVHRIEKNATAIENKEAFIKYFNKTRQRLGILSRNHPLYAKTLKNRLKQVGETCGL